jgi:hypothetical protein
MLLAHTLSFLVQPLLCIIMKLISNCRMHMETFRQSCNRGQTMDDQLESQHCEQFVDWFRDYIRLMSSYLLNDKYICFSFIFPHQFHFASSIVCNTLVSQ